jgi:hypothetical protein
MKMALGNWMTLKEQKPEEGERVYGFYYSSLISTPEIIMVERKVDSDEYEAFNNDNGEDMGEPDFWTPMPMEDEVSS